jgi:hypothetical protein
MPSKAHAVTVPPTREAKLRGGKQQQQQQEPIRSPSCQGIDASGASKSRVTYSTLMTQPVAGCAHLTGLN